MCHHNEKPASPMKPKFVKEDDEESQDGDSPQMRKRSASCFSSRRASWKSSSSIAAWLSERTSATWTSIWSSSSVSSHADSS
ncbi:unnamed protein product [Ixodes persulcatus]